LLEISRWQVRPGRQPHQQCPNTTRTRSGAPRPAARTRRKPAARTTATS